MVGLFNMKQNKTYYGYKPKEDNLSKLQRYLLSKNADKSANNALNEKVAMLSSNKVLKNKRF
jgi:hypothetical protein